MSEISNSEDINKIVSNFQTQSLKREIELLDEKLRILDKESQNKINNLTNQLAQEKESEIKLRNQLSTKDKAISELNEIIKDYQSELIAQKKSLSLKDEKLQEMMIQFNSIKSNCNTISAALNSKEENQKKNELELRKAINDKIKIESKIKELIGVVNEYMKQLDELNDKCSNLERENNNLKIVNSNLVNENKKLFNDNNEYSNELKNIKETIDKCEEMSKKYVEQNKQLKIENDNLNNQLMENKQRIDSLLSENNKLNLVINEFKIKKSKMENDLAMTLQYQKKNNDKHENDMQDIISYCNDNINKIINWIDNTFGVGLNPNNDNNNLNLNKNPISLNSSINSGQYNINFDQLKQKLNIIQDNMNKDKSLMAKYQEEATEKYNLFMIEKGKYLDILKKIYNTITSDIHTHNYFICDYHINSFNNNKNDEFLKLLNLIEAVINQVLRYLSSVSEEKNLILNEIDKYKHSINDMQVINDNLIQENNDYKVKLYNNDYAKLKEEMIILQDNYDKCLQMNQMFEKKIKNYETEFELKQMQINSLEEMVKRRSNNFNNNTENNNSEEYQPGYYNNSYNSTSLNNQNMTIQKLEQDREKLIKDNMKLIQYNKKLKEQINNLNQIINSLTNNNNSNNNSNEQENNENINLNNNNEE